MPLVSLLPKPRRVLIIRLSAIGDVIHGLPVLCALREQFPDVRIAWLVEGGASTLLEGHPALDELIRVPRGWLRSPATVWRLCRQLREFGPDLTVDVQGLTKSAIPAWLSGARFRIGFGCENGRELSRWLNNIHVRSTATHIIDCNLQLLQPLGIQRATARFDLPERADDAWAIERIIRELGVEERFAVINVGAGWTSKLWRMDRFAAVARQLARKHAMPTVVVWAGPQERAWAEEVVAGGSGFAKLAPSTTLTELAALVRRAALFIGSDTGPLHLAAAVGTPCVGLFGPKPAERNGPYGPGHIVLQAARPSNARRQRSSTSRALMDAISVEMVCQACERILAAKTRK